MRELIVLAMGLTTLVSGADLVLARNGKSDYAIVVGTQASPSERHGAEELQRFLLEISGARLPIQSTPQRRMIVVGRSAALDQLQVRIPFEELGPEGFAIKTAGRNLVIAGGAMRGTMYGVYSFLEKLGCRWYAAGVSRIPQLRTIEVAAMDEAQKPAFEYREPFFSEAADRDWAARNKMNGVLMNLDASTGGKVEYYPFVHSFNTMVPPEKYFAAHPEYFSLIDGKRRAERSQLCLTNPEVLRVGVEAVEGWIAEHPEATIFSVSQNDWTGWCECDNCRRVEKEEGGSHSGPLLRYVNALAAEIEKKHPDKLIDTLAYWYTEDPPSQVRPRANVRIRLCPIGVCEAHPYGQCKYSAYFMKNLEAWSKITRQLYIWHYNTNFAHYLLPFPDFDELASDIPMYKDHGVVGLFMEGAVTKGGGAENAELRSYVMAKLLWDTKADVRQAVEDFHEAFYGKAAAAMREYFELMQRQVRMGSHLWIYDSPGAEYLNDGFLAKAEELFRKADATAENDAVRARVRKARLGIDYVRLMQAKEFRVEGELYQPGNMHNFETRWSAFSAALQQFGITNLRESSLLARDAEDVAAWVRPYRVATLDGGRLRVRAVAELGGRVIEIFDKRTGKDLLQRPSPGVRQYPNVGGLVVAPYSDYVTRDPWLAKWELVTGSSSNEIRMTGVCENGLRMTRRLWIEGSLLRTRTVLENAGKEAIEAVLQSRWEVDPGAMDGVKLSYRTQGGGEVSRTLLEKDRQPSGTEGYESSDLPAGEWRVGGGMVNRFAVEQVARCYLNWTAKNENRVAMTVASRRRKLEPGEQLILETDYGVVE